MRHQLLSLVVILHGSLALASSPRPLVDAEAELVVSGGRPTIVISITSRSREPLQLSVSRPGLAAATPVLGATVAPGACLHHSEPAALGPGEIVRVLYDVEAENASGSFHGKLVLQATFMVGTDGSVRRLSFDEELRLAPAGDFATTAASDEPSAR